MVYTLSLLSKFINIKSLIYFIVIICNRCTYMYIRYYTVPFTFFQAFIMFMAKACSTSIIQQSTYAKSKMQISCALTAQLIGAFVFAMWCNFISHCTADQGLFAMWCNFTSNCTADHHLCFRYMVKFHQGQQPVELDIVDCDSLIYHTDMSM